MISWLPQNVLDIKNSLTQEWQTNYDSLHLLIGHRFDVLNSFPMERKINLRSDIDPNYEAYPEITEKNIRWLKVFLEGLKSFTCAKKTTICQAKLLCLKIVSVMNRMGGKLFKFTSPIYPKIPQFSLPMMLRYFWYGQTDPLQPGEKIDMDLVNRW